MAKKDSSQAGSRPKRPQKAKDVKSAKRTPAAKTDDAKPSEPKEAQRKGGLARFFGRIGRTIWRMRALRIIVLVLAVLVALPLVLTPLYAVPGVRPVSTLMLADLVRFQGYERQWRDLDAISDNLKMAVITSEDGQFCRHHGIDLGELRAVVQEALAGESPRGASTLTMQVAKNLFLWPGRSVIRKGLELPLAVYIDLVMSKERIFEIYLNIAEWAPGNRYGIEVGALHHFGIDADAMTKRQAALLAVTLPNPHVRDPARPSSGMARVARIVERRAQGAPSFAACVITGT